MVSVTCFSCCIVFGVPDAFDANRQADSKSFHCPLGHSLSYTESTADKLRKEKDAMALSFQAKLNESEHLRLVAESARNKAVKDKQKVERRIAHGVCPCCNTAFSDVAQHMLTEHKDFRLPAGRKPKIASAQ